MPLCFAYGSNMDRAAMAARCPGSRPLGLARLPRHRVVIMREGYASVARELSREVWGLLWAVALADIAALDRYEDVASGLYAKRLLSVLTGSGPRQALVYIGCNDGPGLPRPGYLEGLLDAAADLGLPPAHLARLAELGPRPAARTGVEPDQTPTARAPTAVRATRASPFHIDRAAASRHARWTP